MSACRAYATAVSAVVAAAGWTAAAPGAAPVPNPCKVVPFSTISTSVGLQGASLVGKLSTRPDGTLKQTLCTFKHDAAALEIYVAPHQQSGGSGGPPGMVLSKPTGLGAGATFAYDQDPKYEFANASFTKGAFDAGVWDNGKFPAADVLALARIVYKAL